jgi:sugar phosphate isomerase/epimerase
LKLCALDVIWYDLPVEKRLKKIAELGFAGVQCWLNSAELGYKVEREWPTGFHPSPMTMTKKEMVKLVEDLGLKMPAYGQYTITGPMTVLGPTPVLTGASKKARIDDIKGLIDLCAEVGAEYMISESGGDPNKPEQWKDLLEWMNELVDYAEKQKVVIAMENTRVCLVNTEDALLRIIQEVDSKHLKACYDPANDYYPGKDLPKAVKKLKGHMGITHAKDTVYGPLEYGMHPDGTWHNPPIGQGQVPWTLVLDAYKEIGFDGYFVIEYSYPFRPMSLTEREIGVLQGKNLLEEWWGR